MNSEMNRHGSRFERPHSEQLVDLHIYIVPQDLWQDRLNSALNQIVDDTVSGGFVRVLPETTIYGLREEVGKQIGFEVIPRDYVFLKSVGRCLTRVKPKQELQMKVKHFLPPHSYSPEIFLLEPTPQMRGMMLSDDDSLRNSSYNSSPGRGSIGGRRAIDQQPGAKVSKQIGYDYDSRFGRRSFSKYEPLEGPLSKPYTPNGNNAHDMDNESDELRLPHLQELTSSNNTLGDSARDSEKAGDAGDEGDNDNVERSNSIFSATPPNSAADRYYNNNNKGKHQGQNGDITVWDREEFLKRKQQEEEEKLRRDEDARRRDEDARRRAEEEWRQDEESRRAGEARRMEEAHAAEERKEADRRRKEEEERRLVEEKRKREEEERLKEEGRRRKDFPSPPPLTVTSYMSPAEEKEKSRSETDKLKYRYPEDRSKYWEKELVESHHDQNKPDGSPRRGKEVQSGSKYDSKETPSDEKNSPYASKVPIAKSRPKRTPEYYNKIKKQILAELEETRQRRREIEARREDLVRKAKQLQAKTQSRRNQARDMWKKKYFEEKKKTPALEDKCNRLRHELELLHRKIVGQMEGGKGREKFQLEKGENRPSEQSNLRIQATKLHHEIEEFQRRVDDAKMKLTGEVKLRNQAEAELRALRAELTQKKINVTLTRSQKLAALGSSQDVYTPHPAAISPRS